MDISKLLDESEINPSFQDCGMVYWRPEVLKFGELVAAEKDKEIEAYKETLSDSAVAHSQQCERTAHLESFILKIAEWEAKYMDIKLVREARELLGMEVEP